MTAVDSIEIVMQKLERLGVIRRWWCEACSDQVPFKCLEMTERQSRHKHGAARHRKVSPELQP